MRVSLVHNPDAGDGRPTKPELLAALRDAGHDVRYHRSSPRGVAAAVRERADAIVVAGGDGTVTAVGTALRDRAVPLAVLPLGTANNIARALGLAAASWRDLVRGLDAAAARRFDVARASTPQGTREFLESAGVGVIAELLRDAERRVGSANTDGVGAGRDRLLHVLERAVPRWHTLDVDGADLSGEYLLVEALNVPAVGPRVPLAPDARVDDGVLHVVRVGPDDRDAMCAYVAALGAAGADTPPPAPPRLARPARAVRLTARGVEAHVDDARWPTLDGEPLHATFTVGDAPALQLLVPPDA